MRRIPLLAAPGASLALAAAAQAQQANPATSREIFTPVDNDLALTHLRKLLGCVVDGVWKSAACTDDRPLTVALGYFNIACLIVATILACYLLYSLVADTANDGEPFGRQTDTKWTLLRVMAGAIFALPIKSGLSLIQLLVVQVAVWGSGAGDTLWQRVAAAQLNGMYGSLPPSERMIGDFVLRANLARALEGRLYGQVCKAALEDYARNVSGGKSIQLSESRQEFATAEGLNSFGKAIVYTFADPSGYFRNSDNLCGAVSFDFGTFIPANANGDDAASSKALTTFAEQYGQQSIERAMGVILARSAAIAGQISGGIRDDVATKRAVVQALNEAENTATQSLLQSSQLQGIVGRYLDDARQNGWLSAVMWQRSMTAVYAKLLSVPITATCHVVKPADPTSYIPYFGRDANAYTILSQKAERDIGYVNSLSGLFAAQSTGNPSTVASDSASKEADGNGLIARTVSYIYANLIRIIAGDSTADTTAWKDPILEAQQIGNTISYFSMGAAGLAGGTGVLSRWDVTGASGAASTFMWMVSGALFAAAFVLSGLTPFMLVVHFILAAINWFLVIAEAMVAVPVWLLTKFMPARGTGLVGDSSQGYFFLLGILLRPPLIIVGLLLSLLMMRVGFDIANIFFRGALSMMSPDGTISSVLLGVGGIVTYVLVLFTIILLAAGQISALPEQVLGWLSHTIERRAAGQAAASALPAGLNDGDVSRGFQQAARDGGNSGKRASQWWTRRRQLRDRTPPLAGS